MQGLWGYGWQLFRTDSKKTLYRRSLAGGRGGRYQAGKPTDVSDRLSGRNFLSDRIAPLDRACLLNKKQERRHQQWKDMAEIFIAIG